MPNPSALPPAGNDDVIAPSFNHMIYYVLDGAAYDGDTWKEGYRVFKDAVMKFGWLNNSLEALEFAVKAAITAAIEGHANPDGPVREAWARYDRYMYGDTKPAQPAKPAGRVRQAAQSVRSTFAR
jgi:hypothetical protein